MVPSKNAGWVIGDDDTIDMLYRFASGDEYVRIPGTMDAYRLRPSEAAKVFHEVLDSRYQPWIAHATPMLDDVKSSFALNDDLFGAPGMINSHFMQRTSGGVLSPSGSSAVSSCLRCAA